MAKAILGTSDTGWIQSAMISRAKKIGMVALVAVFALAALINYVPVILYYSFAAGVGVAKPELNEIQIEMQKWWVPVSSPGSLLEPFLSRTEGNKLIFLKGQGNLASSKEHIIFSQLVRAVRMEGMLNAKSIAFDWGSAYVVDDVKGDPNYRHFYSVSHNLLISATSVDAVGEIKSIRRR